MTHQTVVIVNGMPEYIPENTSIADLIVHFKEGDRDLIVELNGRFLYPPQYQTTLASDGDRIEFINPNFGG